MSWEKSYFAEAALERSEPAPLTRRCRSTSANSTATAIRQRGRTGYLEYSDNKISQTTYRGAACTPRTRGLAETAAGVAIRPAPSTTENPARTTAMLPTPRDNGEAANVVCCAMTHAKCTIMAERNACSNPADDGNAVHQVLIPGAANPARKKPAAKRAVKRVAAPAPSAFIPYA